MKKKIQKLVDKPLEVGKTYKTLFSTGEKFTVTKITKTCKCSHDCGHPRSVFGIYEVAPHLGPCPLAFYRIIPEQEVVDVEIEVCECCEKPLNKYAL